MSSLKKRGPLVAALLHFAVAAVVLTGANTFESWRAQRTRGVPVVGPAAGSWLRFCEKLFYVLTGAAWASIVRWSVSAVICTLRGFADSATGMRRISTPVS
jgi:hypothetical protein